MAEEYAIELRAVKKVFGEVAAVQKFDVGIRKGEFFSLLGPSGCGKTTTLRLIAGLEEPTEGAILLEGRDVSRVPAYRRNVHTVFQDYALFPHMDVRQNIWFPLRMRGVSASQALPKIRRVLRLVNMEEYERRLPQQLSGGQRQRIALARSLVDEPAALLLDEPLGALDFKLRVAMQKVLKDIQRDVGITFIYVTHDQTEALTMSDRIAVMKDGWVHQIGTPGEIYNRPATAFVASFIGDMNFLRGRLAGRRGGRDWAIQVDGRPVVSRRLDPRLKDGEEVLICIRTERVQINPRHPVENSLEGRIRRVVYRGTDFEVTCRVGGGAGGAEADRSAADGSLEIRAVVSSVGWDPDLGVGAAVRLGFDGADVAVFPRNEESQIIQYSTEAV